MLDMDYAYCEPPKRSPLPEREEVKSLSARSPEEFWKESLVTEATPESLSTWNPTSCRKK